MDGATIITASAVLGCMSGRAGAGITVGPTMGTATLTGMTTTTIIPAPTTIPGTANGPGDIATGTGVTGAIADTNRQVEA